MRPITITMLVLGIFAMIMCITYFVVISFITNVGYKRRNPHITYNPTTMYQQANQMHAYPPARTQ